MKKKNKKREGGRKEGGRRNEEGDKGEKRKRKKGRGEGKKVVSEWKREMEERKGNLKKERVGL